LEDGSLILKCQGQIIIQLDKSNTTQLNIKDKPMKSYNPEMHTAEHVLNRTMVNMFGCDRSFSNHLEKKKSKCDYHFDRALTDDEEQAIEAKVNEILSQHVDVKGYDISREEAQAKFKLDRLPELAGEELRVVIVGD